MVKDEFELATEQALAFLRGYMSLLEEEANKTWNIFKLNKIILRLRVARNTTVSLYQSRLLHYGALVLFQRKHNEDLRLHLLELKQIRAKLSAYGLSR